MSISVSILVNEYNATQHPMIQKHSKSYVVHSVHG